MKVVVRNDDSSEAVSVDWNASSFVDLDGNAQRIIPGSARLKQLGELIPASSIPMQSQIAEVLIRQDRVDPDADVGGLVSEIELEELVRSRRSGQVRVVLAVTSAGRVNLVDQAFRVVPGLAEGDTSRDTTDAATYEAIEISPGRVCVTATDLDAHVVEDCFAAVGADKDLTFAYVASTIASCAEAEEVERRLRSWKGWRKAGHWTLPWVYTTPLAPVALVVSGGQARKAEEAYARCASSVSVAQ